MRMRKSKKKKIDVMGVLVGGRRCESELQEAPFQLVMENGDKGAEERELHSQVQLGKG